MLSIGEVKMGSVLLPTKKTNILLRNGKKKQSVKKNGFNNNINAKCFP